MRPAKALAAVTVLAGIVTLLVVADVPRGLSLWVLPAAGLVAVAEWVLDEAIGSVALPQHPRRSKAGVRISYLPESLAREIRPP